MHKTTAALVLNLFVITSAAFSQKKDSVQQPVYFSGSIGVTNNGISIIPTFSLGKPAAMFIHAAGRGKFSVEPDIRFSLKGKPWGMVFWARYKAVTSNKFLFTAGTHLGLNYRTSVIPINGDSSETTIVRRYLAAELFPRYMIAKNTSIGIYYLYSHGLDAGTIHNTNFITLNINFSNIRLTKDYFLKFNPQPYYLKLDKEDGYFFTAVLTLVRNDCPLTLSGTVNQKIRADITGSKTFVWNVIASWVFNNKFIKIQHVL